MNFLRTPLAHRRVLTLGLVAAVAAVGIVAGVRRLWAHAGGHEVPGGSSMDLKYPRFLNKVTRETLGIKTAPVKRRPIEEVVRVTGVVRSRPDGLAKISAPVAGRVREVRVNVGGRIGRDDATSPAHKDVLLVLDSIEAARLQNNLTAEARRLVHARHHRSEVAEMSRRTALHELLVLVAQYRTAAETLQVAEDALALTRRGGESVARKDLLTAQGEQAKAAAQERSLRDRLASLGLTADAIRGLDGKSDSAGLAEWLKGDPKRWAGIEVLGKPFDLLEKDHEVAGHETEVERLAGELRLLGLPEDTVKGLIAGTAKPQPLVLRSPVAGTVTVRNVSVGQAVQAEQVLFEVADTSKVWIDAEVPEALLGRVLDGRAGVARIRAVTLPEAVLGGTVVSVSPAVDPQTRTAHVVIEMDNPDGRLRLGTFVEASLVVREAKQALTVPKEAIVRQGPITFVWIESGEGDESEYEKRDVVVGAVDDQYAEIAKGDLSPLHTVVVRGAYQLTLIPAVSKPAK